MKISILTPNFSENCFGRAWLLAKLLQPHFDIEMIGPAFGNGIWEPLKNLCNFRVKIINGIPPTITQTITRGAPKTVTKILDFN